MKAMFQLVLSRKALSIFLLIAGVLFSTLNPGSLSAVQAQQGGSESISGTLTILRGDSQDGSTREIHMLAADDGRSIPLLLEQSVTEPVGGALALDRKHITVRGDWSGIFSDQGGSELFRVDSIAPLAEADVAAAAVTGSQKWISIMCKFQENTAEPKALAYFQNMYMNSSPALDHYWRQQSYDRINTLGSTAMGWFVLPRARSYYMSSGRFNLYQAAMDCTGVANPSVNFAGFSGINLMFNDELDGYAWGGTSPYMTLDGLTKIWNMTWEPPWGYSNVAVLGHEMGHAFGLPHSSGNYGATYDNEWDVMSDTWTGCRNRGGSDAVYGCMGQHTISYHKDRLGWIPAAQKISVGAGTAKAVVLEQLALPQTANLKMVKILIGGSASHFYTVEVRHLTGYDAQLPGPAVVIHDVLTSRIEPAHVIDVDNNRVTGDSGAMWTTGEIFRNNTYKIAVAVLAKTKSGFRVHVNSGLNIYYITGNIGVSGVTIKYTGGSTTTDSTGRYIFPVARGWSGTVIPSKAGARFSPAKRSYSNIIADKTAQNFTATISYSISGNTEVAGTALRYTTNTFKTVYSQTNGNYSLVAPKGWSGLVTPSHPCYVFNPANRGYASLAANKTNQNYVPTFDSNSGCADVYAYLGEIKLGRFGLPAGTSGRASFAGVNAGPVRVSSTNQVPLFASERVNYKVNGVYTSFSEMMALPASQVDKIYWLPWYNNRDMSTQLRFGNTTGSVATVHVLVDGQDLEGSPVIVGPYSSTRKSFAGVNTGPVQIVSDVEIVASARLVYRVAGTDASFSEMMALPASQLDKIYWLPWYNNQEMDTQLRIANVSGANANVQVFIGGVEMTDGPFLLATGETARLRFDGINTGPVHIVSDQNIVASERVIYSVDGVQTSFSEMMALPEKLLHKESWLPWYNNRDMSTQLRITNASGIDGSVQVFIGGVEMTDGPVPLGAGASTRMSFNAINAGPVYIVSDQNIVVSERVVYSVNGIPTSFSEVMGLPGGLLDFSNWLPYYNNLDMDTQLRFATP